MRQFNYFPSQKGPVLKEFYPEGANSFLEEWTLCEELFLLEKYTGIHVIPFVKLMDTERLASQSNIISGEEDGAIH